MKNVVAALLLAIGIALGLFLISHAIIDFKIADRHVSVKGLAEQVVKSDKAIWQLQFNYASDDLTDLYKGIASAQQKAKDFLQNQNFSMKEIEMQPVSVIDNQANNYNTNDKMKHYIATAGITLNTKEVDKVRESVQKTGLLVEAGLVITQSNVQYVFTQLNDIKPAMLNQATTNAKLAAESFAANSHSNLGEIRTATQGLFTIEDASGSSGTGIMKQVRIVTTVEYFLHR